MKIKRIVKATCEFVAYCDEFYGTNGVYPMGATTSQICEATLILLNEYGKNVQFDSLDRERVRDIMIEKFGLVMPNIPDS